MNRLYKIRYLVFFILTFFAHNISFAQIPAGYYYIADGKKNIQLKSFLSTIVSQAQMLNYGSGPGATWQGFYFTDRNSDNSVIDMYSPVVRYFPENYGSINGMHIEHSLPKSWWGARENNAYKDLFHLYPADGPTNSAKNNLPLGEVTVATTDNGVSKIGYNGFSYYVGRVFEPADEYKGDFARSYLYMSVAYENFGDSQHRYWNSPMINNNTYPVWQKWAIDLLLKWHRQDPVSEKERTRQEQVFQIQGNRNPFIDYPDLVEYIWGTDTNNIYHFPNETQPFMIQPNRWSKVDFGVVMLGSNVNKTFQIWGKNINSNVTVSIKNSSPAIKLSQLPAYNEVSSITFTASQVNNAVNNLFVDLIAQNVGSITDTLVLEGGGLENTMYVPVSAIVSPEFMTLEPTETTATTASLTWMSDNNANSYLIRVYKSTAKSADLFFSGYIEGSSYNKALVLYNNTGKTLDLSKFSIKKQTNGTGNFTNELQLSGSLSDGQKYVLVHNSASDILKSYANQLVYTSNPQDNTLNFNGNDALGLYHNGVLIDVIGIVNEVDNWGIDITLQRKSEIIHPKTDFSFDQWNILPTDDFSPAISHSVDTYTDELFGEYTSNYYYNNSINIQNLSPQTQYIYEVRANRTLGNITSVNRVAFNTKQLETPFALDATDIDETSFTANWEDVEGAENYLLDVYQIQTGTQQTETENFNGMSGTNYPVGWSGNTNAYYTGSGYYGQSAPAVSFNATAKYLQTKTYPAPVSELSFWYRFPSGANSSLRIQGNKGDEEWFDIDNINQQNTTAQTATYSFDTENSYTSFKFIMNKPTGGGNVALDDVVAKYFTADTTYILNNLSVDSTNYSVGDLTLGQTYFYRVKSQYQEIISDFSNQIAVTTQIPPCLYFETLDIYQEDLPYTWHNPILGTDTVFETGTLSGTYIFYGYSVNDCDTIVYLTLNIPTANNDINANKIFVYSTKEGIYINGTDSGDKITVYSAIGTIIYRTIATSDRIFIPIQQNGIYIVKINNKAFKIVK
ncbi:MAG: endonuclease [Paludibacter sp.]|nr:endonuclease [Paludibacter sp.]